MKNFIPILVVIAFGFGVWLVVKNDNVTDDYKASDQVSDIDNQEETTEVDSQIVPDIKKVDDKNINNQIDNKKYMKATLHTSKGDIEIEFLDKQAPKTVANFTKLAGDGFYEGVKFHRVIKGFMIQGGDPLTKDDTKSAQWGTGGPGYTFADELGASNHNDVGTISMANAGPNTNGSQFFINTAANNFLDPKHTVFGKVTAGMDVVTAIENVKVREGDNRPIEAVVIKSISLK